MDPATDVANCGACGTVCPAIDACTPAQCSSGACNHTSSCTGFQTCGGGGVVNQCGCTPAKTCPGGQNCGTAPDGCGGTISSGTCTAPANATATCTSGTCGFTCNAGFKLDGKGGCVAISLCPTGYEAVNGACFQIVSGLNTSLCAHTGCNVFGSVDGSGNYLCANKSGAGSCSSNSGCPSGQACFLDGGHYCIAPC